MYRSAEATDPDLGWRAQRQERLRVKTGQTDRRLGGLRCYRYRWRRRNDRPFARHREARPATWRTIEAPTDVGAALLAQASMARVILLDCLTLLVSNLLLAGAAGDDVDEGATQTRVDAELEGLWAAYQSLPATLIVVSNEVGLGLVPPYAVGRIYRDVLGRANQWLAARADAVYFLVAGIPMVVKGLAPQDLAGG